jgi:hypothetical protein
LGNGWLGIAPIPGRTAAYLSDLATLLRWEPTLVLTMRTSAPTLRQLVSRGGICQLLILARPMIKLRRFGLSCPRLLTTSLLREGAYWRIVLGAVVAPAWF